MRTTVIVLILLCLSIRFYGQSSKEIYKDWKIGTKYSYDNITSSDRIDDSEYIGYFLAFDKYNYTTGITVQRNINTQFSLISGLEYSNKDFTAAFYCAVCNFIGAFKPEHYKLRFLQIPINLQYEYKIKSFSLFATGGLINSITIKNQLDENNYLLSGTSSLGIGYEINKNWSIELSSTYTKSLSKLYSKTSFNQSYTGINLAIKKGF